MKRSLVATGRRVRASIQRGLAIGLIVCAAAFLLLLAWS
jgi:hypothetical protein